MIDCAECERESEKETGILSKKKLSEWKTLFFLCLNIPSTWLKFSKKENFRDFTRKNCLLLKRIQGISFWVLRIRLCHRFSFLLFHWAIAIATTTARNWSIRERRQRKESDNESRESDARTIFAFPCQNNGIMQHVTLNGCGIKYVLSLTEVSWAIHVPIHSVPFCTLTLSITLSPKDATSC